MLKRTLVIAGALLLASLASCGQPTVGARANPHPTPVPTVPMGVSHIVGFEMGPGGAGSNMAVPEASSITGSPTVQATVVRSGGYAMEAHPASAAAYASFQQRAAGGVLRAAYQSFRFYLQIGTLPNTAATTIARTISGLQQVTRVALNADGSVLFGVGVVSGASTSTLSADGAWHLIEGDVPTSSGTSTLYVDGTPWVTLANSSSAAQTSGEIGVVPIATADLYFDDVVWYDAPLGGPLGSDYSTGVLLPVSDKTISPSGAWVEGAGGAGSLFAAIKTVPPAGLATETDTSQDKSASSTNPAFYVANMAAYATLQSNPATIGTILGVQPVVNHAENVGTGTKSGDVWISGNPAQSQPSSTGFGSFNYGDDSGAVTNFTAATSTWRTAVGPTSASPSVTLATQPTVRVDKIDAGTREANIDFLGLYVMYTLVQPPELTGRPYGLHGQQQMHQLLAQ